MDRNSVMTDVEPEGSESYFPVHESTTTNAPPPTGNQGIRELWWGYLRARWLEHLQGIRFWIELDRRDFALLPRTYQNNELLLDRVLDRIKAGQTNLDVIQWAQTWNIPVEPVMQILETIAGSRHRLEHRFGSDLGF